MSNAAVVAACGLGFAPAASGIIVAGTTNGGTPSNWDGVGAIYNNSAGAGTGVLLDSMHVLTAAHVLKDSGGNVADPKKIAFTLGNGDSITASSFVLDPGFQYIDSNNATQDDLAVITLSKPATGHATYAWYTGTSEQTTDSGKVTLVGWGVSGNGTNGSAASGAAGFGTQRAAQNVIDLVVGKSNPPTLTDKTPSQNSLTLPTSVIAWDFDDGTSTRNPLGGLGLGSGVEGDIANGDSGAPILQFNGSSYVVVGVATDATDLTDRYGDIGFGTRVSDYNSFIAANVPEPTMMGFGLFAGATLLMRRRKIAGAQ